MPDITLIPAPRVPPFDKQGNFAREWYRFFYNLFQLTGSGTSSTTIIDLTIQPQLDVSAVDAMITSSLQQLSQADGLAVQAQLAEILKDIQAAKLAPASDRALPIVSTGVATTSRAFLWDEASVSVTVDALTITLPKATLNGPDRTVIQNVVGSVTVAPTDSDTLILPTTDTSITIYTKGNSLTFRPIDSSTWAIV